ncbi:sulfur carrier protein ThiS [Bradymonas sediminis]|uniref:Thiamine biosynthesis protein ThiS n=1 Tax=Bradymonas sediminis TaxID=1548548 RepID=A0A2Z4FR46_9DELT|nr:sulfur carrier protein ThiS [Bradymonas sediminis]AWV91164.1 thiamine biosynthesis protein ThiS [Bradymonas sediminis]
MNLIINGENKSFQAEQLTIREMLGHLDITQRKGVAVALNNAVIPQSQWEKHAVADGDHVEVIRATQGG